MKKRYNVLSLFGGMECGRVALEKENIPVGKYYSSEIDKYAIQIALKNYPNIIRLGDVKKWREWDIDFSKIDLLLAGFPCQAWSMAGKQGGDSDPRGALVHDLIDIWNEIKKHNPDVKFLFENVRMKKEFLEYINNLFGVEPICINSALVSAQNRVRYYWTNIDGVEQPKDRGVLLKDILEYNNEKIDNIVIASYNPVVTKNYIQYDVKGKGHKSQDQRAFFKEGKHGTLPSYGAESKAKVVITKDVVRKLTPIECERLQTLPDNYTEGVSNTQRYKMIGNGWTVDVIAYIFRGINL